MSNQRVGIIAECVCDLPRNLCIQYGIEIVDFLVETDTGEFTDGGEITAGNLLEYLHNGGKTVHSHAPQASVYRKTFEKCLQKYDEAILISISEKISRTVDRANEALSQMGDAAHRIHTFDSECLSTGIGHMVIRAAKMAASGADADDILAMLKELKKRVVTTFIVDRTDYMTNKGLISPKVSTFCTKFSLHPVLILRNGEVTIKSVKAGRYEKACRKYIRSVLKNGQIDKSLAFITHVGCSADALEQIKNDVNAMCHFDRLEVTEASAAVSSNCGRGTFGVLFVKEA